MNHEKFIRRVADLAIARLSDEDRAKVHGARIVYGSGLGLGARGVTFYSAWKNGDPKPVDLIEICAAGEESPVQVAGTTIHELGHVLAGPGTGHGPKWKAACMKLGLRRAKAAGMVYQGCAFAPEIRFAIAEAAFEDGQPAFAVGSIPRAKRRPCSQGVGTRGGKSRGKGSGSRLRKWICGCTPKPVIARVASDDFRATCDLCCEAFRFAPVKPRKKKSAKSTTKKRKRKTKSA